MKDEDKDVVPEVKKFNLSVEEEADNIDKAIFRIEALLKSRVESDDLKKGFITQEVGKYIEKLKDGRDHLSQCLAKDEKSWIDRRSQSMKKLIEA